MKFKQLVDSIIHPRKMTDKDVDDFMLFNLMCWGFNLILWIKFHG